MTAYTLVYNASGSWNNTGSVPRLAIQAVSYDIRVAAVSMSSAFYTSTASYAGSGIISRFTGGVSGGTAVPIVAYRDGVPDSTAFARSGCTVAGTQVQLVANGSPSGAVTLPGTFDVLISAGHSLTLDSTVNVPGAGAGSFAALWTVDFEELRLSWHF